MRTTTTVLLVLLSSAMVAAPADTVRRPAPSKALPEIAAPPAEASSQTREPVGFTMRNVRLHAAGDVVLDVAMLDGHLVTTHGDLPVFDDQQSFYVNVDHAEISANAASVTGLVRQAFAYKDAPIKNVRVEIHDGKLEQKGKLGTGISVPFSMKADVAPRDGRIQVHPEKLHVLGIPAARFMKFIGTDLSDVVQLKPGRGVEVRENDLLLEPSQMLKAPQIRGRVTMARIDGDRLRLVLGSGGPAKTPTVADAPRNFIWFRGGEIRFGRLTRANADLQLIDADPSDAFDFYPEKYNDQLVAGYSRNTPEGALRTMMPDYSDVGKLKGGRLTVAK